MESWTFTVGGCDYIARTERDDCTGAPWEEHDGHGIVSEWTRRDKRAGELVLAESGGVRRFYDFAATVRLARKDGWDAPPYRTGTARQRAARAALADFERLRAWCNDEWFWCGVIVAPVCPCCGEPDESRAASLWGMESDSPAYLREVAEELAREVPEGDCPDACAA
jgi:hypothetical protein